MPKSRFLIEIDFELNQTITHSKYMVFSFIMTFKLTRGKDRHCLEFIFTLKTIL
jgi:hypothetical protein